MFHGTPLRSNALRRSKYGILRRLVSAFYQRWYTFTTGRHERSRVQVLRQGEEAAKKHVAGHVLAEHCLAGQQL